MAGPLCTLTAKLAEGSPYTVTPTENGFDVALDVANATWFGLISKQGLQRSITHHVRVDEEQRTYTVLDDSRTVEWRAGPEGRRPAFAMSGRRQLGRTIALGARKEWGWDEKLRFGKVLDYTLDTEESRALIRAAADHLGYREKQPGVVKGAMVMAVVAGVGALVAVVTVAVMALTGRF